MVYDLDCSANACSLCSTACFEDRSSGTHMQTEGQNGGGDRQERQARRKTENGQTDRKTGKVGDLEGRKNADRQTGRQAGSQTFWGRPELSGCCES